MKVFSCRSIVNLLGLGIILGALFCIFPLEMLILRRWAVYAGQIMIGPFNEVSRAPDIRAFRQASQLKDSRRGFLSGLKDILDKPTDHIFYSEELSCITFQKRFDFAGRFLGISGTYQCK